MKQINLPQPLTWQNDRLVIIDQTKLPQKEIYLTLTDYRQVMDVIKTLQVRGAPAIGIAGGYGMALGALQIKTLSRRAFLDKLHAVALAINGTRPTAKNLSWALERIEKVAQKMKTVEDIRNAVAAEALAIHTEEVESTRAISRNGARLIKDGMVVLTHCNTGPLAAPGYGTALGCIFYAHAQGKNVQVFADETRPLLQGARLTTWECVEAGVPVTLITDSMAGRLMNLGLIDCVIVGADRIAANGDTANKIGTYTVAVLSKENNIPFYVAAPVSTFDLTLKSGAEIPIEQRDPDEVTHIGGKRFAAIGAKAVSPAFDVTPAKYITAIITEKGIIKNQSFPKLKELL